MKSDSLKKKDQLESEEELFLFIDFHEDAMSLTTALEQCLSVARISYSTQMLETGNCLDRTLKAF